MLRKNELHLDILAYVIIIRFQMSCYKILRYK